MADRPGVPCRGQGRESAETQDKCNAGCDVRSRCGWTTGWAESEAVAVKWALLHAVVWSVALWATSPDGDCTKSGDCKRGEYCKNGTCVPKEAK